MSLSRQSKVSFNQRSKLLNKTAPKKVHIHFIGVGGIGMSALAMILADKGYSVSGSDTQVNNTINQLISSGVKIFNKQNESNINEIINNQPIEILIVKSSAISKNNIELIYAKQIGLKILHRSEILAYLIRNKKSILIAGTHGKTTTSTYLATLLALCKTYPSVAIGGIVPLFKSNYTVGKGKYFVAEADESDGSLIRFKPNISLITNIELDHTDYYKNLDALIATMRQFADNSDNVIANYDCINIRENIKASIWWSIKEIKNLDFAAIPIKSNGYETTAAYYEQETFISEITIPIPGIHNLSNAIGAIAGCRIAGIPFKKIKNILCKMTAPERRFEIKGIWDNKIIIDDYAHHPSEIRATISMARLMIESKKTILPISVNRIIAIFQPHRYSRTKQFHNEFALSLIAADIIIIAPIYSAGEKEIKGITHHLIADSIKAIQPNKQVYCPISFQEIITLLKTKSSNNDLILNMGAGNINTMPSKLLAMVDNNIFPNKKIAA